MNIAIIAKRSGRFVAIFVLAVTLFGSRVGAALTTDQQAVISATVSAVQTRSEQTTYTATVSQLAIVGSYALTTWLLGESGGQALLQKKSDGTWSVMRIGAGQMGSDHLVAFGVPSATATGLESALAPVPTPTP